MTQSDMAKAGGVAFRTYCDYESGKSEPKASAIARFGAVGVDVLFIITGNRSQIADVTPEERKLVENYRALDDASRLNVQAVSDAFASAKKLGKEATND